MDTPSAGGAGGAETPRLRFSSFEEERSPVLAGGPFPGEPLSRLTMENKIIAAIITASELTPERSQCQALTSFPQLSPPQT